MAGSYPETPLDRSVAEAIAAENENPRGLPADILAGMEADVLANPNRYPLLNKLIGGGQSG